MAEKIQEIPIDKIKIDKATYPREIIDFVVVSRYRTCLENGDVFPPIDISTRGDKYILMDGAHRLEAFKKNKFKTIPAVVYKELTDAQILAFAIKKNAKHGRQMSPFEITKCILRLRDLGFSKKDVCAIVSIPSSKIDNYFDKRTIVLTNSLTGKAYTQVLKKPLHFLNQNNNIDEANVEGVDLEHFSSITQTKLVEDLISLLGNKLIHKTNIMMSKLNELKKALDKYLS